MGETWTRTLKLKKFVTLNFGSHTVKGAAERICYSVETEGQTEAAHEEASEVDADRRSVGQIFRYSICVLAPSPLISTSML